MITTLALAGMAHSAEVGFVCTHDDGGGVVGLPPLEIACSVVPPEEGGTYSEATWTFGDGNLISGDEVSFVYEEVGQYTVSVQLEDYVGPDGVAGEEPHHIEFGYVTICGAPVVRFGYKNKGGLDYEMENKTIAAVHCIDSLAWEVFEGGSAEGEPAFAFDTWSPRFDLPNEGPWTVRLTVAGLAGVTAAELTIDAEYSLTEDLTEGPKAVGCATSPWAGAPWMALAGLLLGYRRRR